MLQNAVSTLVESKADVSMNVKLFRSVMDRDEMNREI